MTAVWIDIICPVCLLRWKYDGTMFDRPACPSCSVRPSNAELRRDVGQFEQMIADSGPDLPALEPGNRPVVLTFDDGAVSHVRFVATVLRARSLRGVFAIVTSRPFGNCVELGIAKAQELEHHGHVVISHTHTHPDLSQLSPDAAFVDIRDSMSALRDACCWTPGFTYPFNRGIGMLHAELRGAGIEWALATTNYFEGAAVGYHAPYLVPRASGVLQEREGHMLVCLASWCVGKVPILTFHSVGEPGRHGDLPERDFVRFLDWLLEAGASTTTDVRQFCRTM